MTLYEMTAAQKELYELMTSGEIDEEVYADTLEGIGIPEKRNRRGGLCRYIRGYRHTRENRRLLRRSK